MNRKEAFTSSKLRKGTFEEIIKRVVYVNKIMIATFDEIIKRVVHVNRIVSEFLS